MPIRRPGERGKSAAKDELDSDEDSHSPIEGLFFLFFHFRELVF